VGREVEVSILGNNEPVASLPAEIRYGAEWYDYATKYAEGQAQLVIPAPIGPELTRRVQELGVAAFKAIDCAGMAPRDLLLRAPPRSRPPRPPPRPAAPRPCGGRRPPPTSPS